MQKTCTLNVTENKKKKKALHRRLIHDMKRFLQPILLS